MAKNNSKSNSKSNPTSNRPKRSPRRRANPIDDALARLERDIPKLLRQLRKNVQDLHSQVARARTDGEKRWQKAELKIKQDANRLRSRLEGAVGRMRGSRKAKPSGAGLKSGTAAKGPKGRKAARKRST